MLSRADLDFLLYTWLDIELLTKRERYAQHSRETFNAVLELSERVAGDHFATHNRLSDAHEPVLVDGGAQIIPEVRAALEVFARTGLIGSSMDEAVGGMQLPHVVTTACFAWFQAANIATSAYPLLTVANANLLIEYGTPDQVDDLRTSDARPAGSSEPCVCPSRRPGSSLADITTRAEPQGDGSFRLAAPRCGSPAATMT